jgi:bidirectional [NiFe] hydrogenase diaphorase subunit
MLYTRDKLEPPSDDKRWKIVMANMRQNGFETHAVIEALNKVQSAFGYITEDALKFVAKGLRVPLSKVYGVATFYHLFSLKPQGKHTCVLCTGTACYIKGIPEIIDAIAERTGVKPGQTSKDNSFSLVGARCIGACGLAPAGSFDNEVVGNMTPESTVEKIEGWLENDD